MRCSSTKSLPPRANCPSESVWTKLRRAPLLAGAGLLAVWSPKLFGLASDLLARGLSLLAPALLPPALPPWPQPGLPF
ncbi:MAG: hypothetical protein HY900_08875 [Deltaproteobacteria bacterium]|nr:hypothetical protein [Deltaproteobacteria bacterium]